ncbi:glycine cleavage system protein GcvH [Prochlorococcus sp. MIT 1300]|uniref:glycine cleavage system protein GcvH n=1 Tax=Prochlorococcus sp. MIT 1300 TaxID=3096218 RepID=UPI002A74A690|nr:glycine cleavage system protein GcvH [Prochlorococcus sp. MIT 1300]
MAFNFPEQYRFADSHEYAFLEEDLVRVGISAFAVDQLGDIVFVDLPEVGDVVTKGQTFGSVESVKAVEDMYSPISGEVVRRNESVLSSTEELQNDPHGEGWLLLVRPSEPSQLQELMDASSYANKVAAN